MNEYIPNQCVASTPEAQISGAAVRSFAENLLGDDLVELARKHKLYEAMPEQWYSQQQCLDAFREIAAITVNSTERMVAIGMAASEKALIPPGIETIHDAIAMIGPGYRLNHRFIDPRDTFTVYTLDPAHVIVIDGTPFPAHVHYGFLWNWVKRYRPAGNSFIIRIIDNPYASQTPGTAYDVMWGSGK